MATINATSLYQTANQIILKCNPDNSNTWQDLYRLVPDLRNSLCCVVCGNLLIDPQSPTIGKCQHHLCRQCKGGTKKVKPACVWCNNPENYSENKTLRSLLQYYKNMCIMLINSEMFRQLVEQAFQSKMRSGLEGRAGNLIMLIKEGAKFQDDYQINGGLSKSVYSSLPCIYTNSSTPTLQLNQTDQTRSLLLNSNIHNVTNGNIVYSVTHAGSENKIPIKRKPKESTINNKMDISCLNKAVFKKPSNKKRGCRCGKASATPGKVTCFGQRCTCYAESKPCMECQCLGCRNPYHPDGTKVRTHTPHIEIFQPASLMVSGQEQQLQLRKQPLLQNVIVEQVPTLSIEQLKEHLMIANIKVLDSYTKIPTSLPDAIFENDGETTDNEDKEITLDV